MPHTSNKTAQGKMIARDKVRRRDVAPVTGSNADSRLRAVLRALAGAWVDYGELAYDLACHHIAIVADVPPILDANALRPERQLLQVEAPDGGVWTWLGGNTRISEDELDVLIAGQGSLDASVAFGEPAKGIAGFAASHHQAQEAKAFGDATNQVVRFANFRVQIAVLRDGDLAKELVEHELDGLGRPGERMSELRETLRVYLEHSQSVSATAVLRRRNRKTIERQLRTIEQLIRHRVSDRSVEVLIALQIGDILRRH